MSLGHQKQQQTRTEIQLAALLDLVAVLSSPMLFRPILFRQSLPLRGLVVRGRHRLTGVLAWHADRHQDKDEEHGEGCAADGGDSDVLPGRHGPADGERYLDRRVPGQEQRLRRGHGQRRRLRNRAQLPG